MTAMPSPQQMPAPNHAGSEAIRVATAALGCSVEFVVLEESRALVVGAGDQSLKPRPHHPCEREVYSGFPIGLGPHGTAVAVDLGEGMHRGALYAAASLETSGIAILSGLANMLATNLGAPMSAEREGFTSELARVAELEQQQRAMVQSTLDNDQLVMFFQPVVDIDNQPIGVEALARIKTPTGEIVTPGGFIDAIDGTSLMVKLDGRAFEMSCRAAKILAHKFPDRAMFVSCNFSATTLAEPNLARNVLTTIRNQGVSPEQLCIEATETAVFEAGTEQLKLIRDAGVRVALDNFGTGYTEISGLRELPLTSVKIDRSFTEALDKSGTERAIATMILEMAKSLGLDVVAEGVENARQWRAARALGIERMQGWFYAPALPFDELLAKISPAAPAQPVPVTQPVPVADPVQPAAAPAPAQPIAAS